MGAKLTTEQVEVRVGQAVRRLQALAVDGVAPTREAYNAACGDAPSADALRSYGLSWAAVVRRAGLRPLRKGPERLGAGLPAAVEKEIRAAFQRGNHLPMHKREWPLAAIPGRLEVREELLPDGSGVRRVTRAVALLR